MTSARDLADRFHQRWLTENPFSASMYGIPGYDDLMPDESEEGEQAWRAEGEGFLAEGDASQLVTKEGYERNVEPGAPHFLQGIKEVIEVYRAGKLKMEDRYFNIKTMQDRNLA